MNQRKTILDGRIMQWLFVYGWVYPGEPGSRRVVGIDGEMFDVELGTIRHGEWHIPASIMVIDHGGNGTSYQCCRYSIRRILAGRIYNRVQSWVYRKGRRR